MNLSSIDYNKESERSVSSPRVPGHLDPKSAKISPHPLSSSRSPVYSGMKNSLTFNEGDNT
jgi:hypothetical protein